MLIRFGAYLFLVFIASASSVFAETKVVPQDKAEIQLSFAPLVKQTANTVVNVFADKQVERPSLTGDPFFDEFFGQQLPNRTEKQSSLGSGVIFDASGLVITNYHVIDGADHIRIALADGREFPAKVTFQDHRLDLAILHIEAGKTTFEAMPIGDSDAVDVGDLVLAIGNPFGVGQTVTSGIVSGLARSKIGEGDFSYFIQTDASINPGNSGGALIDMKGELIGINTAIVSRDGGSNGIGFAIPVNLVKVFIASAMGGQPGFIRPYLGASFDAVTSDIAESLGLKIARGALVQSIVQGGPADKAGLKAGDVVTAVNGRPVEHPDALTYRLTTAGIGSTVKITFLRDGAESTASLTLDQAPEGTPKDERLIDGQNPFAGALVANLSPRVADALEMPTESHGVVIERITDGSPAARLGFAPKDIIININGKDVTTTAILAEITQDSPTIWRVEIERDGQRIRQFIR